jgi:hypothetical protein
MLAVKDQLDSAAARRTLGASVNAMTLAPGNENLPVDAELPLLADAPSETTGSSSSWMFDWTRAWATAATSMLDASATALASNAKAAASEPTQKPAPKATQELSLWSMPPSNAPRARSWYRQPQPNLFDPTVWGFPAPLAIYGVPVPSPFGSMGAPMGFGPPQGPWSAITQAMQPSPMMGWASMLQSFGAPNYGPSFGQPFNAYQNPFARQPENPVTAWIASFTSPAANPWAKLTPAPYSAPYSAYRSDSGYAVAQVSAPTTQAVSADRSRQSAQEAAAAIWNLFAWPTATRQ